MIISCTMAGTGNGPEVLNRSPGPVTRLQLDRKIKCDVCEALIVPTSYKRYKKTIHNDNPQRQFIGKTVEMQPVRKESSK